LLREFLGGERHSIRLEGKDSTEEGPPLSWTAWRVPGVDGTPDSVLALAEDATTELEAQRRLRQAERLEALGRLVGGVAHDFNNVLTGVLLYCDLLMVNLKPGEKLRKYAEEIRSAGMQATGLVRQLLAVARPSAGVPSLLSLNQVAEGMSKLLARLIGENVELAANLDPSLGLVRMDAAQAQQVILNLVLNARDAMPGGGRITIDTSNCKVQVLASAGFDGSRPAAIPCALMRVGDNGCGMDDETRAHLFEAFFTTKVSGRGTGLGLATVYDIVTGNGGLIHVDSTPGRGTRVTVLLPLAPEPSRDSRPATSPTAEVEPDNEGGAAPCISIRGKGITP
jgi:two-component system, cell cycle sensor histidine kinase and response regulator CckA